ncbi:hypothetical protein AAC387_Pa04g1773 [Persea americana]
MGCEPPRNANFSPISIRQPAELLCIAQLPSPPPAAMANLPPVTTALSQAILQGAVALPLPLTSPPTPRPLAPLLPSPTPVFPIRNYVSPFPQSGVEELITTVAPLLPAPSTISKLPAPSTQPSFIKPTGGSPVPALQTVSPLSGHLTAGCPYAVKPGLLKLPAKVIQMENPPPSTAAESAKDASTEDTQIPVPTSEISGDIDSVLDASVLVSKIVAASQVNSLPQPRPPPIGPQVSVIAPTKAVQPECLIMSLRTDIIYNILDKFPTPVVDTSNPFSFLEHCSVIEPTSSTSLSKSLIVA